MQLKTVGSHDTDPFASRDVSTESNERRVARVWVSAELLLAVLRFPDDTILENVGRAYTPTLAGIPRLELLVSHPDLPAVKPGQEIRLAAPTWSKDYEADEIEFRNWGLEDAS